LGLWLGLAALPPAFAADTGKVTLSLKNVKIAEVMDMLSRQERVNILVTDGVDATLSVNLYDMEVGQAIRAIANAAGYAVEHHDGSYFVVERDEAGKYASGGLTQLRTFKIQYSDPTVVEGILKNYLSNYGKLTTFPDRRLLVVEDLPEFLERIAGLLAEVDRKPRQILIEAKILEIQLRDTESFGIDWAKLFRHNGGEGAFGTRGLSNPLSPGLFFDLVNPDVEIFLDALKERNRLRTLSTPKLLALEDQQAESIIGDKTGYRVTTTINEVTTESIEFLDSGVILRVTPSVDEEGRIIMRIHPEVSTTTVSDDGIPSQTTTEVTTHMVVGDGETVFIGGLIKHSQAQSREGVPVLGDIPLLGRMFSNHSTNDISTETVVLITPHLIDGYVSEWNAKQQAKTQAIEALMEQDAERVNARIDELMGDGRASEQEKPKGQPASHKPSPARAPPEGPWYLEP
jgi:type II secretory pathway component GspD/PulD (secretin)